MAKKKIKDLTLGEYYKIRGKCSEHRYCDGCPFHKIPACDIPRLDTFLEKEIEVEEDKPQKCKDLGGCC